VTLQPFAPMPLERRREAFDDPRWIFELKYDGFRALAYVLGRETAAGLA
jgi:ATP-dependent DNA ligase